MLASFTVRMDATKRNACWNSMCDALWQSDASVKVEHGATQAPSIL